MSNRERRSVSLGRHRDRGSRDTIRPVEEDLSTRHNISNFLLTLQRIQASEEENRLLRKENQLLRQRTRTSRLSSSSFRGHNDAPEQTILPDEEDKIIAADVKRNSLMFVGDSIPSTGEHAALEAQYKKLQADFDTVKEFLKHLFQHALTMSSPDGVKVAYKDKENTDINTYNPSQSKQLEHSLHDIHGQISQLRNSQDRQQIKMEQVQQALDNVLCQSSVRNDVTMRLVRQQDKLKEISKHTSFLEAQLMSVTASHRQAEERLRQTSVIGQKLETFIATSNKNLKGNTKDELNKITEQINLVSRRTSLCSCKMSCIGQLINHIVTASSHGQTLLDTKPPAEVVEAMSKLERLIGSDWHRLGRMLGLNSDCLDDIGKFTNFDLTSRVEKVIKCWVKYIKGANAEGLRQGLDKMDRDVFLITEQPVCKEWTQLPPEVITYCVAHLVDTPSVISQLGDLGILSQDSRSFILGASQEHRRAGRLLQSVVYMGTQALAQLTAVLDRLHQCSVANKIRGCLPMNDSKSFTLDHNNTYTPTKPSPNDISLTITPSKTSTPLNSKTAEKQPRKKRSRSLFARKNKLRDSEPDSEIAVEIQGDYNYYYPAVNLNALNTTTSSGSGSSSGFKDETRRDTRRQYGRLHHGNRASQASDEVIV
ncbi:uncharacterized protein LOC131952910 [Physella acuta]|uniref:uncharacterized protein LOC131952910 n=1 Tax=Physella acuta TaxID=109671 RepID=UPI0027DDBDAB|nr:uncharacterized protein LOC131952910 [Physella acuta]